MVPSRAAFLAGVLLLNLSVTGLHGQRPGEQFVLMIDQ